MQGGEQVLPTLAGRVQHRGHDGVGVPPHPERKPPVTLRWTTEWRSACSEALFVGGTAESYRKTNNCSRWSRNRTHSRLASAPTTGAASKASQSASSFRTAAV